MRNLSFADAIDDALAQAMANDSRIVVFGEDVHTLRLKLFLRFGGQRVRAAPISEAAFLGAAVGASMAGLRPIVEIMMIDFIAVAADALINHAAKVEAFSGGRWRAPLVVRASCGGGYGDAGQHEQSLWGWLAHIPGLVVVVPSTPEDAGRLMLAAIEHEGPVVYLEHKLLADYWLDYLGGANRSTVHFDVPSEGVSGLIEDSWKAIPLGKAAVRREGNDITLVSVAVGVHRCLEAATILQKNGISAGVIDLRTVLPLDVDTLCTAISGSGRLLIVDEDYRGFGLSGEIAALMLESGIPFQYGRVCTESTIPYDRERESQVIPNTKRIVEAVNKMMEAPPRP